MPIKQGEHEWWHHSHLFTPELGHHQSVETVDMDITRENLLPILKLVAARLSYLEEKEGPASPTILEKDLWRVLDWLSEGDNLDFLLEGLIDPLYPDGKPGVRKLEMKKADPVFMGVDVGDGEPGTVVADDPVEFF